MKNSVTLNEGSRAAVFLRWEGAVDWVETHNIRRGVSSCPYGVVQTPFSILTSSKVLVLPPKWQSYEASSFAEMTFFFIFPNLIYNSGSLWCGDQGDVRVSSFPARPPLPITAMPIAPSTSVQLSSAGSPRVYLLQSETEIVFAMFANAFQEKPMIWQQCSTAFWCLPESWWFVQPVCPSRLCRLMGRWKK